MYYIEILLILCDSMMNGDYQDSHFMEILITAHKGGWYLTPLSLFVYGNGKS